MAGTETSGIAAARLVLERGGDVVLYDGSAALKEEDIKEKFDRGTKVDAILGEIERSDLLGVELRIVSPGIFLDSPFVPVVDDAKIPTLEKIEPAYQCDLRKLAATMGINEKATTTVPTGEISKARYEETLAVGNTGNPYTSKILKMTEDSMTVAEVSSLRLETIMDFKPNASVISSITPDHLNRHGTMENYIRIKECITLNQTKGDAVVFNYDDSVLRGFDQNPELKPRVIQFPDRETLKDGFCVDGGNITYCQSGRQTVVTNVRDMQLPRRRSYGNTIATAATALEMGVSMFDITRVIEGFHPVEHRIEFVVERIGARYYNDSKRTNPGVAIQALRAVPGPTLLIAGGYGKNSEYDEWMPESEGKIRYLVLIGQTRDKIAKCAKERSFTEIMYTEDMQEAVQVCVVYVGIGNYVLLGPAYASWDMFKNYEERGRVSKERVMALQEVNAYGGKDTDGSRTLRLGETAGREREPGGAADAKEKEGGKTFL